MKRIMNIYEYCKLPIRVVYFGIFLISFGFLIGNESVNLFYTFKSPFILNLGDFCLRIGEMIIINIPLIFMVNIVCKKANSGLPIVLSLIGYITFLVTMALFGNQNLGSNVYMNYSLVGSLGIGRFPFQTGLIGSFIVGYLIRIAFIISRYRTAHSILSVTNKDTAAIILSIFLCFIAGLIISYIYPLLYALLQKAITDISSDLMDPKKIALYGLLDRGLSILGLGGLIRHPFWFSAAGGSYSNSITGQAILGDVNIWAYLKENNTSYLGAGRFITPYYIINMFIVPAIYLGILLSITNKQERNKYLILIILGMIFSFIAGNPLPIELTLLFTSPLLLIIYLGIVSGLFAILVYRNIFLGFTMTSSNVVTAMPGSFPDYLINIRNIQYTSTIGKIVIMGLIFFAIMLLVTIIYYRLLSFDAFRTGKLKNIGENVIDALGGLNNIESSSAGFNRTHFDLVNLEDVSIEKLKEIGAKRVLETRNGISIEFGSSSLVISKYIDKLLKKDKRD